MEFPSKGFPFSTPKQMLILALHGPLTPRRQAGDAGVQRLQIQDDGIPLTLNPKP